MTNSSRQNTSEKTQYSMRRPVNIRRNMPGSATNINDGFVLGLTFMENVAMKTTIFVKTVMIALTIVVPMVPCMSPLLWWKHDVQAYT